MLMAAITGFFPVHCCLISSCLCVGSDSEYSCRCMCVGLGMHLCVHAWARPEVSIAGSTSGTIYLG